MEICNFSKVIQRVNIRVWFQTQKCSLQSSNIWAHNTIKQLASPCLYGLNIRQFSFNSCRTSFCALCSGTFLCPLSSVKLCPAKATEPPKPIDQPALQSNALLTELFQLARQPALQRLQMQLQHVTTRWHYMKTDTTSHPRDHFNQELCSGIQTQIGKIKKIKDIYIYVNIYTHMYVYT